MGVINVQIPASAEVQAQAAAARPAPRPRLDSLQVFRGVAALLVVLHHAGTFSVGHFGAPFLGNALDWGASGVDFFFVLSGFIIYFIHRPDLGRPERLRGFALKRLVRVYPIYWVACGVVIPLYFLSPGMGPGYARDPGAIVTSLLLIPQAHFPVLGQAWTLTYEMLFYGVFGALIWRFRVFIWPAAAWMATCAVIYLVEIGGHLAGWNDGRQAWRSRGDGCFAAQRALRRRGRRGVARLARGRGAAPADSAVERGGVVPVVCRVQPIGKPVRPRADVRLPADLRASLDPRGDRCCRVGPRLRGPARAGALLYLGNASYSIYLFHSLAMSIAVRPLSPRAIARAAGQRRVPAHVRAGNRGRVRGPHGLGTPPPFRSCAAG